MGFQSEAYTGEFLYTTLCFIDCLDPVLGFRISSLQSVLEWRQPGIKLDDTWRGKLVRRVKFLGTRVIRTSAVFRNLEWCTSRRIRIQRVC